MILQELEGQSSTLTEIDGLSFDAGYRSQAVSVHSGRHKTGCNQSDIWILFLENIIAL